MTAIAQDTVLSGENIVSLAARLTGNALDWQVIIRLNKLRPPYLIDEPRREGEARGHQLRPGDAVLYPAPNAPTTPPDAARLAVLTYRRDLKAEGGDLVLSGGHLTTEAGLDNLHAALTRRLRTLVGRHPFHPPYGSLLHAHIGKPADYPRVRLASVDVKRAVLRDPRVQSCVAHVTWEAELMTVDVTVTPIPPGTPFRIVLRY